MSARELIVLGTASQVPTRYRNHNAFFLRWDAEGFLFDPGEGTQRQMLHAGLTATQITRIFITHFHGDHALGLAGMIQRISLDRVPHGIHVYYPASGQVYFDRLRSATIFVDMSRLIPHPISQEGVIAEAKGFVVEARRLDHGVDTYGYAIREHDSIRMLPDRLAALGIQGRDIKTLMVEGQFQAASGLVRLAEVSVPRPGQRFAFVMDTRPCRGARALADGADLLVCESTYLESEREEAHAHHHTTARQAAEIALASGVRKLVLAHFSQRYTDLGAFRREALAVFPDVHVSSDLDVIDVPKRVSESAEASAAG